MARRESKAAYEGLTQQQASRRLFEYGENVLEQGKKNSAINLFLGQFKDMMVVILLVATALSVFMGEAMEALTIVLIVLVNAILGFAQEYRTEKTLEALGNLTAPTANVMRDGRRRRIPASELVPGDFILLEAGDRVPADARMLEAAAIQADEAMLSGESVPVEKEAAPEATDETVAREARVFMGTSIVRGRGTAVVTKTGMSTEMGKIAGMLSGIKQERTPLQVKLDGIGKHLAIGCVGICAIVAVTGILRGEPIFDMLLTGISLAVAAIPEGLPAVVTIALALAVKRMLGRGALIRKLHSVETMGCASVICSDKTGTLTENRMTVKEVYTREHIVTVTGTGVQREGELLCSGSAAGTAVLPDVRLLLDVAVLCNNAAIEEGAALFATARARSEWTVQGEPTEAALLVMAAKGRVTRKLAEAQFTRIDELPFDSVRKCMSVIVRDKSGMRYLLTKGAPDVLLGYCSRVQRGRGDIALTANEKQTLVAKNEEMARRALRVLAFAYKVLDASGASPREEGLTFIGFVGMIDPPRKEAFEAVRKCRRAGIRTVMITGDHKLTAAAIASELGILRGGDDMLTGTELNAMGDDELGRRVGRTTVYARVSPEHKLRIVRALKKQGNVVAMTGDGVNDAPAVKEADIGVAMGEGGTDVTKEASSVILMDDNFATLVAAIEEGRVIYANIRKFIRYLLSCNIGEVITMFLGMLMGMPVVLLPIQILLINLATDGLPAIALGLDPPDSGVMELPPRGKTESIFSHGLLSTILFRGCLIGLTTVAVFSGFLQRFDDIELARTAAFATLVLTQLIHVFECKSEGRGLFGINLFNNIRLILAVIISGAVLAAAIYVPQLAAIFSTVPLSGEHLLLVAAYVAFAPVLSSIMLLLRSRRKKTDAQVEVSDTALKTT